MACKKCRGQSLYDSEMAGIVTFSKQIMAPDGRSYSSFWCENWNPVGQVLCAGVEPVTLFMEVDRSRAIGWVSCGEPSNNEDCYVFRASGEQAKRIQEWRARVERRVNDG